MEKIWTALRDLRTKSSNRRIASLFDDGSRFSGFSSEVDGVLLDYSKTNIDDETRSTLINLAKAADLEARRDAMFSGEKINSTEDRAVLHTALRGAGDQPIEVDGVDVVPEIQKTRARMEAFAEDVRSGQITAVDGAPFTDVINIGIGGSDLGPHMATLALAPYHDGPRCHFVSNVDGAHLADTLKKLRPERTLVVVVSKTFTTIETMTNANSALRWLAEELGDNASKHLAAVSSAIDKTSKLGIEPSRVFGFGDYIGGRYSLWGPVGLTLLLAIGAQDFRKFLQGAASMDRHFQTADLEVNLPVLLALVGIWHRNICKYPTRAVLPYDERLSRLPAYLQQLDMESNGKSVSLDGVANVLASGPIVWGEPGTNGQHAFYQLLHQGSDVVPVEFLIATKGHEDGLEEHHAFLKANCLAQSEALMIGRSLEVARGIASDLGFEEPQLSQQAAHRTFEGNRPSITLAYKKLTPFVLGQIIALYEHRVFTEATIWGINPFDQWGVELGKELANTLLPLIEGGDTSGKDGSTQGLVKWLSSKD